jgi:methylated-DNA-protein-cysteine methyltransferase-like protein
LRSREQLRVRERGSSPEGWSLICEAVQAIPRGRVASYGQVAELAGLPGRARLVGRVLSLLPPKSRVPWHRVVNARGELSLSGESGLEQRRLLEREGVRFGPSGRVDLRRFGIFA